MKIGIENLYNIRYRFYKSEHIKEIICAIDAKAYDDNKPEYANAKTFFEANLSNKEVIEKLETILSKYRD